MDESFFEDSGFRQFKYIFFVGALVLVLLGVWKHEEIMKYTNFGDYGKALIVIESIPGTKVTLMDEGMFSRELGVTGENGLLTLEESKDIVGIRLLVSPPNYLPEEFKVDRVARGEVVTFRPMLSPSGGGLKVDSFPTGAKVFVNDEERGKTPWSSYRFIHGDELFVTVKMDGYVVESREVEIRGGEWQHVVVSLNTTWCTIDLLSPRAEYNLEGVRAYIDGESVTLEDGSIKFVEPGLRALKIVSRDGLDLEKTVNIKPGQTLEMRIPRWFFED